MYSYLYTDNADKGLRCDALAVVSVEDYVPVGVAERVVARFQSRCGFSPYCDRASPRSKTTTRSFNPGVGFLDHLLVLRPCEGARE